MAKEKKARKLSDIKNFGDRLALAEKRIHTYNDGDSINVNDLADELAVSTSLFYQYFLPKLSELGIPKVVFDAEKGCEDPFVNERGLIVIGKTKHEFPIGTKFAITKANDGLTLIMNS